MTHCSGDRLWGEGWVRNRNLVQFHHVSSESQFTNSSGQPRASFVDFFEAEDALGLTL